MTAMKRALLAGAIAMINAPRIADVPVLREKPRSNLTTDEALTRQQRRKAQRAARKKTRQGK